MLSLSKHEGGTEPFGRAMGSIAELHPMFHLGALASVIALALRGQFQLRILLLISFLLYVADDYFGTAEPAWPSLIWNGLFFLINLYVLVEIILDRTTFGLSPEEKEIFGGFLSLSPGEFRKLIRIGRLRVAEETKLITTEGVVPGSLFYVHEGAIEIIKAGRTIPIEPPTFIGEVAFLRGSSASATVAILPGARYIEWSTSDLHRRLARHNPLRVAFNRALSDDLATKVARA